jgi:hypothetical protein
MKRERRHDEPLATNTNVAINSDLLPQITGLVNIVLDLSQASSEVPTSSQSHASGSGSRALLSIDHTKVVDTIVAATSDILRSPTVVNVNNLVKTSTLLRNLLGGCGCVEALGLGSFMHSLDEVIDAALALQKSCGRDPVTVPSSMDYGVPRPTPLSDTSNSGTVLSLDDLLALLALSPVNSHIGQGPSLDSPLNGLLNDLEIGPKNVDRRTVEHGLNTNVQVNEAFVNHVKALVDLVIELKNDSSLPTPALDSPFIVLPVPASRSGPPLSVDEHLVDAIVQATANLLNSADVSSLLDNLSVLIDINSLVASTLAGCDCVANLGLVKFMDSLNKVLGATLALKDWCAYHPVVVEQTPSGPQAGSSSSVPDPQPHGSNNILGIPIDLGLSDLLAALGLDVKSNIDANVQLQDAVNSLVKLILDLQNDSTSLPLSPSSSLVNAVVQATGSLLQSLTSFEFYSNVDALLKATARLGDALSVDLGLGHLANDVNDILNAALVVKSYSDSGYPVSPLDGGGSDDGPGSPSTPVIINAEELLKLLGLNSFIKVDGIVDGLGDTISQPVNALLASLGLGGVKRWFMR